MQSDLHSHPTSRVLIVGGGVAGCEAALALRDLAGDRVAITILARDPEFVYRPMRVLEPFSSGGARRYPLERLARDVDAELVIDGFRSVNADTKQVRTASGRTLEYDHLLLAMGAHATPAFHHVLTIDDAKLDEHYRGLVQDVDEGYVKSLAFIAPTAMAWPLPLYELAMMTARRGWEANIDLSVTLITPEDAPLGLFGATASEAVRQLLTENRVTTITSSHCTVRAPGRIEIHPGNRDLVVDRVVALPLLAGPTISGVPRDAHGGFIPIDRFCRVRELTDVYAAGDACDFAVKHGGIASQQADTAALSIAAAVGAPVEPKPLHPEVRAILLGGDAPLYMSANLIDGHGSCSQVGREPISWPADKIAAKYLAPYLRSDDHATLS